ncbi:LysR family transcriptional regulator [Microvirga rosea]|uniref:LysR family transcriptional regulator n=1 Tax=Microvirga rosea TaxID=2715425 RepID=UPI001D0A6625|nr:LysR family transcriptional regulator [Microvirga rosea]MCB8822935.1 LysR family transcriptional regulator [Microvirga rosea]
MSRLKSLTVFVRVAELGSFAAAARDLELSPAMVGNHIRALEEWFSTPLLLRTTRQQSLTDAGQEVLAKARHVLAGMAALESLAERGEEPSGPLRLSAPIGIGRHVVAPALRNLARTYPKLKIELRLSDLPEDMVKSGLDLAIRNGPLPGDEASLIARVIARQTLILAASPSYLTAYGSPRNLGDLLQHKTVRYSRYGRPRPWLFPSGESVEQIDPPTAFMSDDIETLCDAAREGLGITWLPSWLLAPHIAAGTLAMVLPEQEPWVVDTFLIRPASPHFSAQVLLAADVLAEGIFQILNSWGVI